MVNNFTLPGVNDTRDLFSVFRFINDTSTDGLFFPLILLGIWVIVFVGSVVEGRRAVRAWIYSSFVALILGILLGVLDFLARRYIYLLILFVAFGVFWINLQKSQKV